MGESSPVKDIILYSNSMRSDFETSHIDVCGANTYWYALQSKSACNKR